MEEGINVLTEYQWRWLFFPWMLSDFLSVVDFAFIRQMDNIPSCLWLLLHRLRKVLRPFSPLSPYWPSITGSTSSIIPTFSSIFYFPFTKADYPTNLHIFAMFCYSTFSSTEIWSANNSALVTYHFLAYISKFAEELWMELTLRTHQ